MKPTVTYKTTFGDDHMSTLLCLSVSCPRPAVVDALNQQSAPIADAGLDLKRKQTKKGQLHGQDSTDE